MRAVAELHENQRNEFRSESVESESKSVSWWQRTNFVDRLYFAWFSGLGLVILLLRQRIPAWPAFLAVHAVCLLAAVALVAGAPRSRLWRFLHHWYPLLMFILCFEEVARLSFLVMDSWQDHHLLDLEARFFPVPPTVWLGQFATPWLTEVLELGYFSYFLMLMLVGGVLYRRGDMPAFRRAMSASVLSYMLCYLVFLGFPTEGPAHTLRALHTLPLEGGPFHFLVNLIQRHGGVHGNAFPSSHVSAAVVALIYAWRYAPRLAAVLTPLVGLLCIGAVYDRYHYASDIVGGIATALLAEAIIVALMRWPNWRRLIEN